MDCALKGCKIFAWENIMQKEIRVFVVIVVVIVGSKLNKMTGSNCLLCCWW